MKYLFLICLLLLFPGLKIVKAEKLDWYTRITDSSSGWEEAWHVHELSVVDPQDPNKRIPSGYEFAGVSTHPGAGTQGKYAFIAKLDANGNHLQTVFYGDSDPTHDFQVYEFGVQGERQLVWMAIRRVEKKSTIAKK